MNNLTWFQSWYVKHSFNGTILVRFETNIERNWDIYINIRDTKYNKLEDFEYTHELDGLDWYKIELKNQIFKAEGNFTQLDFLLGKFRELIGESDYEKKKQDYFWEKDIQNFILENNDELVTFLHYTCSKEVSDEIIETGFRFYDFDKSANEAKNQATELNYYHYLHKQFGDFVVVISFSKKLYYHYLHKINSINSTITRVEEILTEEPTHINDNSDTVYTLHNKYIKGYFNYYTKEIVANKSFDPLYDSEKFLQNIINSK